MPALSFSGSFTRQEAIPNEAIEAAVALMRTGRLHRYTALDDGSPSEVSMLEREFAQSVGQTYCIGVASGGYALQLAMRAWGLEAGEPVLTNAFTLSPVPGAIAAVGGKPVLVETTSELTIDLSDLDAKLAQSGARLLLLSHMRGHICNMDALAAVLDRHGAALIEDCAHTMGASWDGKPSGTFGVAGCFSTQTYKHINSGEGGLMTTNDAELMAHATILSGSYMLFERHGTAPDTALFDDIALSSPNMSGRMDNLRAAILRPQLANLPVNGERWNERYNVVANVLSDTPVLRLTQREQRESFVGSSIQFFADGHDADSCSAFVALCKSRGVEIKWFGASEPAGYTSTHHHWHYLAAQELPQSDQVLSGLFDMRLPLTFSLEDCQLIGQIIVECASEVFMQQTAKSGAA